MNKKYIWADTSEKSLMMFYKKAFERAENIDGVKLGDPYFKTEVMQSGKTIYVAEASVLDARSQS